MTASPPSADGPHHLFTYGTLAPDSPVPAARLLAAYAQVVADARVPGTLYRGGGWPAWQPAGDGPVHGTLWALPADARARGVLLASLDGYEGVVEAAPEQSLFVRERVTAQADGRAYDAWIYRFARSVRAMERIPDGRWSLTDP